MSRFVNVFKSLKNDPSKVMVAAIVGDSQDLTASTQQADIDEYFESELARTQFASNTYICSSASGIADYGSRYIDLVKGFGGNGVLANICGPKGCVTDAGVRGYIADDGTCTELAAGQDPSTFGIVRALDLIGQTILRRVVRICLPRPVRCLQEDPEQPGRCLQSSGLAVNRITAAGDRFELVEAPPSDVSPGAGQYRIEEDTLCQETRQALFFGDLLERDDAMVVRYEGDSGLVE